jgi:hypothetical protein
MLRKIATGVAGFAKGVTNAISPESKPKPKVTERRLLPILQRRQELFVVGKKDQPEGFRIEPKVRAVVALVELFRGTEDEPGPFLLFNQTTNVVDLSPGHRGRRVPSFVDRHIEFDLVAFQLCTVFGGGKESEQVERMKEHGFVLRTLKSHPLAADIRRVLHVQ